MAALASNALGHRQTRTQWETNHRTNFDLAFLQQVCRQRNVAGVNTDRIKIVLLCFFAQFGDLRFTGVHRQQGVIDIASVVNVFNSHCDSLIRVSQINVSNVRIITSVTVQI
ncbi:Uncharacterised protein [Serratia odorifera]|uniref:Uncharacterized protein n=1 Tax=Serratia odorifera TaxID=618 RepID=A0A447L1Q4_SEROD|nr:Uncharacterised protein [Serratia odorifera]